MLNDHKPTNQQLLALIEAALRDAPPFQFGEKLTDLEMRWLGRVDALLEASGAIPALLSFRTARGFLGSYSHSRENLLVPLHDAYSRLELQLPSSQRGAFIPAGDTWNGYAALIKIIQSDCKDILVVDPYLNASIFTDFAPHTLTNTRLRCLTSERAENHAGLLASYNKWKSDKIAGEHPVEVRYADSRSLHDRLVILDQEDVWLVSQSFKDIAKRSPASVSRADTEMTKMKSAHYEGLWTSSHPIS